jgi:hypothetical protein
MALQLFKPGEVEIEIPSTREEFIDAYDAGIVGHHLRHA